MSVMLGFAGNDCHMFYGTVVNNCCSDSQEVYIYINRYIKINISPRIFRSMVAKC